MHTITCTLQQNSSSALVNILRDRRVAATTLVVVLTLTRIIKSMVTGQAPVTLEWSNTPGKKHKPTAEHAYITADAIHASAGNISGVSLRCARSILVHTSHYSRLENRLYRMPPNKDYSSTTYMLHVVPITTHTHDRRKSIGKKKKKEEKIK